MSILNYIKIEKNIPKKEIKLINTYNILPKMENILPKIESTVSTNNEDIIKVFTDGACINNGKPNAKAGIGIYFGKDDYRNVSEPITGKQSNNTAELKAILKAYYILKNEIENKKRINIYSDSIYAIRCCGEYGLKMYKKQWKTKDKLIPNHELVKEAFNLFNNKINIKLIHVKAHTERLDELSIGNAEADRLANEGIGIKSCLNNNIDKIKKIYLNIPFSRKEEIKKLGGKWDKSKKKWFIYENNKNKEKIIENF